MMTTNVSCGADENVDLYMAHVPMLSLMTLTLMHGDSDGSAKANNQR